MCDTWLVHMCDVSSSHVWRDLFICVTWHTHNRGTPWTFIAVENESCHAYEWIMSHVCMIHVTHGIRRFLGSGDIGSRWVMLRMREIHVTHVNATCHTHDCAGYGGAEILAVHELCCSCKWVMSHIWMQCDMQHTRLLGCGDIGSKIAEAGENFMSCIYNESCHTYE